MLSPDREVNKRSSIRLTLKTSTLVSQSAPTQPQPTATEVTSPNSHHHRPRHHHNTRRSTASLSGAEEDFKFSIPPLPDRLGYWEQVLLTKFAKLRKLKGNESATNLEEPTAESSPVQPLLTSTSAEATSVVEQSATSSSANVPPSGESAREHAIKLVLSGHLRFESQADTRKCVSRKRSVISMTKPSPIEFGGSFADEPQEAFLKPTEPEPFSPVASVVKIKLPKPSAASTNDPNESPKGGEQRKQVYVRSRDLTAELLNEIFKPLTGYVSHVFQAERSSAVADFDSHNNALGAVKSLRSSSADGIDLYVCLARKTGDDSLPFEANNFDSSIADQLNSASSPVVEEEVMQQKWNIVQRRTTSSTPAASGTAITTTTTATTPSVSTPVVDTIQSPRSETAAAHPMAPRELQTYEDVF